MPRTTITFEGRELTLPEGVGVARDIASPSFEPSEELVAASLRTQAGDDAVGVWDRRSGEPIRWFQGAHACTWIAKSRNLALLEGASLRWRSFDDGGEAVADGSVNLGQSRTGCHAETLSSSPSGDWLVTERYSGQGEAGYDLLSTRPLVRIGGETERSGYMCQAPAFAADETKLVAAIGQHWLGGWWSECGDPEEPAVGGRVIFGDLFDHDLHSGRRSHHRLELDLPAGWIPDDPWSELWGGPKSMGTDAERVWWVMPGGERMAFMRPLPERIHLATPVLHPA